MSEEKFDVMERLFCLSLIHFFRRLNKNKWIAQGFRGIQARKKDTIVKENLRHVIENITIHFGHSHLECDDVKAYVLHDKNWLISKQRLGQT